MNDIAKAGVKFPSIQDRDVRKKIYLKASEVEVHPVHPILQEAGRHLRDKGAGNLTIKSTDYLNDDFAYKLRYFICETGLGGRRYC
jgi:hypothetical protein